MAESFAELFEKTPFAKASRSVSGTVSGINEKYVVIDTGLKTETFIPIEEFKNAAGKLEVSVGDEVPVVLEAIDNGSGEAQTSCENIESRKNLQIDTHETGKVCWITDKYVLIDTGRHETFIPVEEFKNAAGELEVSVGDEVPLPVEAIDNGSGETQTSRKNIESRKNLQIDTHETGKVSRINEEHVDNDTSRTGGRHDIDAEDEFSQSLDLQDEKTVPPLVCYVLGLMFYRGREVGQDYKEAAKWFWRTAARKQNDGGVVADPASSSLPQTDRGRSLLSSILRGTDAISADTNKSRRNDRNNQCITSAQYYLGFMYYHGQGVGRDYIEAGKLLGSAARFGHAGAQYYLGFMYSHGQGVSQDYKEAVKWFGQAARNDHAQAQNALGDAYRSGQGVKQDYHEAVKWYKKAAVSGIAAAQISLGDMYLNGECVDQDPAEAMKWYMKAAQQGSADARSKLEKIMETMLPKNNLVHRG